MNRQWALRLGDAHPRPADNIGRAVASSDPYRNRAANILGLPICLPQASRTKNRRVRLPIRLQIDCPLPTARMTLGLHRGRNLKVAGALGCGSVDPRSGCRAAELLQVETE